MEIEFEFSGGYGGVFAKRPLVYRADTGDLPEEEREALLELVRDSGVLELEEPAARPSRARRLRLPALDPRWRGAVLSPMR